MKFLNVNSDAVVVQTNRLEKMRKEMVPKAVRTALNSAAYDVKQRTMPQTARKSFIHRKPSFWSAVSKVKPATGNDINTMVATVGFVPPAADKGHAVEDLKAQEEGGMIDNRAFIPLKGARVNKNWGRSVKNDMRIAAMKGKIVDANKAPNAKNEQEGFIKSAIHTGKGGFLIGTDRKRGARMVMRINSVVRVKKSLTTKKGKKYTKGDTVVNSTAVYSLQRNRRVRVEGTEFMQKASMVSGKRLEEFFVRAAERLLR